MKKFLLILVVLSLIGCSNPVDEPIIEDPVTEEPVVVKPVDLNKFMSAVQEVYEMTGRTLFYSSDGKTMDSNVNNRVSGSREIPGVCTDYAIEFAYYWNEVKNYDESYGKAYLSFITIGTSNNKIVYFVDINFVPDGTIKYREESGNFKSNVNTEAADGVYRDVIVASIVYSGRNFLHFGQYVSNHMWVVIKIQDEWYDCEPTWWDSSLNSNDDRIPYKINF